MAKLRAEVVSQGKDPPVLGWEPSRFFFSRERPPCFLSKRFRQHDDQQPL
jgi:hypothetical protein